MKTGLAGEAAAPGQAGTGSNAAHGSVRASAVLGVGRCAVCTAWSREGAWGSECGGVGGLQGVGWDVGCWEHGQPAQRV